MPQKRRKNVKPFQKKKFSNKKHEKVSAPKDALIGVYKQGKGNFGFVDMVVDGVKSGYYVHETQKWDALPWDEVAFRIKNFKGKDEAVILKVTKRAENLIIGKLKLSKTYAFVIPEDSKIRSDIFIPWKFIEGYPDGTRVGVQVLNWKGKNPEGRIIETLDSFPEGRQDIYKIALEWWARVKFSDAVKKELKQVPQRISKGEIAKRRDMRDILTFTIDGAESKDLDDAISLIQYENGEIKLFVHIADVAHYVTENSALDREARKRATSIYLCDQVIPMLPKEISNGVCSLHPGEDKLTLTCEMRINTQGYVMESNVYETITHSDYRLTYKEVQEMVDGEKWIDEELMFSEKVSQELLDTIKKLAQLKCILAEYKMKKGVLNFDFPETRIELDDDGNPVDFTQYQRYESHKIIEECMVLANESIGKKFSSFPFLYRIHEAPDEADVEKFMKLLERFGIAPKELELSPKWFQSILHILQSDEKLIHLQKLLLRTLTKAIYSEKNLGHFWLALEYYSHFTSPIRRYPDLQIHRIIKETLGKKKLYGKKRNHYKEILPKVALRSSEREQAAEKMEYRVRDMLAAKYMSDKVGQEFSAKVSWMIEKWFFVELENTIEWFVDFGLSLYTFDEEKFCLVHSQSWEEIHFGDTIQVVCSAVDTENFRIDFELVS